MKTWNITLFIATSDGDVEYIDVIEAKDRDTAISKAKDGKENVHTWSSYELPKGWSES